MTEPKSDTMRVRVVLARWEEVNTDAERLINAMQWLRDHVGNVPVFVDGVQQEPDYDYDFVGPPERQPPEDLGLGILLEIPVWPKLAEYRAYRDRTLPEPSGPEGFTREAGQHARNRVAAAKLLSVQPSPEDVVLADWLDVLDRWYMATYGDWWKRSKEMEADLKRYIHQQVEARLESPYWGELGQLLRRTPLASLYNGLQDGELLRAGVILPDEPDT